MPRGGQSDERNAPDGFPAGQSIQQVNEAMGEIAASGQQIGKIIKTIDEIAFRPTCGLERGGGGGPGRRGGSGFAVVADEVRNLAQRAADAAKNTAQLIEGTISRITQGTSLVGQAAESFGAVTTNSEKVGNWWPRSRPLRTNRPRGSCRSTRPWPRWTR
jgi:methyl-accepting chemotaxis protein